MCAARRQVSTPETDDIIAEIDALMRIVEAIARKIDEILALVQIEKES